MWQYIFVFSCSCSLSALAENAYRKEKKILFVVLSILAIFLGAFLAAVRSPSVGTDYSLYNLYYNIASTNNVNEILSRFAPDVEPLFLVFYDIVAFFADIRIILFVQEFLIIALVYISLLENRDNGPLWLGLWIFYTAFYAFSLNGVRQCLAVAIISYATKYIYSSNVKKFLFFCILAFGFHYTSITCLGIYAIHWLLKKRSEKWIRFAAIGIGVFITAGAQRIISLFVYFFPKYQRYIGSGFHVLLGPIIVRLPLLLLLLMCYRFYKKKGTELDFWIILLFFEIFFTQLRGVVSPLYRISYYVAIFKMHAYAFVGEAFAPRTRRYVHVLVAGLMLIIWYYQIVIQGNEGVYPYKSIF